MNKLCFCKREYLAGLILILLTFGIFSQVRNFDFLVYDDPIYVYQNSHIKHGLSLEGAHWAFTADLLKNSPDADYWRPISFLSHMLDITLYGLNPSGHHVTNLIIHVLNVLLLFSLLNFTTKNFWASFMVAILFAIHPIQSQAVAWITARKDLLSAFFALLVLWIQTFCFQNPLRRNFQIVGAALFAAGLMTKPALVTLPVVMIVFDVGILKRPFSKKLFFEKFLFFFLSALSLAVLVSKHSSATVDVPNPLQYLNIPFNFQEYITHTLLPFNLSIYAPVTTKTISVLHALIILTVLFLFLLFVWRTRKSLPFLFVGSLWFLISISPCIMLTEADRFMYFPIIGLIISLVFEATHHCQLLRIQRIYLMIVSCVLIGICTWTTYFETAKWKDSVTLFSEVIDQNPEHKRAHYILGLALAQNNQSSKAISHYLKSLDGTQKDSGTYNAIGLLLMNEGKYRLAIRYFARASQTYPDPIVSSISFNNMGLALKRLDKLRFSKLFFKKSARINPAYAEPYYNLAQLAFENGYVELAIQYLTKAITISPQYELARKELGVIMARLGKTEEAMAQFKSILQFNPRSPEANNNLGGILLGLGRTEEARKYFKTALRHNPSYEPAQKNLEIINQK